MRGEPSWPSNDKEGEFERASGEEGEAEERREKVGLIWFCAWGETGGKMDSEVWRRVLEMSGELERVGPKMFGEAVGGEIGAAVRVGEGREGSIGGEETLAEGR